MTSFKDIGLKLTPQRAAILEYLAGNGAHPSADEIFSQVREVYPMISMVTIYNTLEVLKDRGLLRELTIDPKRKRYDPKTAPHHHLICTGCGGIEDVHMIFNLNLTQDELVGYELSGAHVEFYGLCPQCRRG